MPQLAPAHVLAKSGALRTPMWMNAVNSLGDGVFSALSVLYLSRFAGLSAAGVGTGLTLAGLAALATSVPIGMLADKVGLQPVFITLCLVEGLAIACYPTIRSWWAFLTVAIVGTCAMRAIAGVRNALIARTVAADQRVAARAVLRSVTNIGTALGAGVAGIFLWHPKRGKLDLLFLLDAASFIAASALVATLHVPAPQSRTPFKVCDLLRNRAFVVSSLSQATLSLHTTSLTIALPLWIATRTSVDPFLYAFLLTGSTIGAVLLQVPVSRRLNDSRAITRATRTAGLLVGLMCLLLAPTGSVSAPVAVGLIVVAAAARVGADLLQSTSRLGCFFSGSAAGT